MYNNQWIALNHVDHEGHSYIRLQDIDRVWNKENSTSEGAEYSLLVFARGGEYLYAKSESASKADQNLMTVLRLIEIAHGRIPSPETAQQARAAISQT